MKQTKRKAFSFLRSYFDVLNEIPKESDKLNYLLAIINKQFLDEDPEGLNFITNLCYQSQRHHVEESVKGYKSKTKDPMAPPYQGACQGGSQGACLQEEEKEEEKEKGKNKSKENILSAPVKDFPDFKEFLSYAKTLQPYKTELDFSLKAKYDSWVEANWRDGNNKPIKNWKTKLRNTITYLKPIYNGSRQQESISKANDIINAIDSLPDPKDFRNH